MAFVVDDWLYQPAGTRDTAKTTSFFDSIQKLITPPKITVPTAPPAPSSGIWDNGNEWVNTGGGGGHWRGADGRIWSDSANSWVEDASAAVAAVSRVGNSMSPVSPNTALLNSLPRDSMDSQYDPQFAAWQQWLNTSNAGRAGSQFDRMGFDAPPTNSALLGYYGDQQARQQTLSQILGFADKAAGAVTPSKPTYSLPPLDISLNEMAANSRPADTGWGTAGRMAGNAGSALKAGYNWLDEKALRPFEETASQLTGPMLKFHQVASQAGVGIPGVAPALAGVKALTGYSPDPVGGLKQLGGSLRESGGNPNAFAEIQDRKFAERPFAQQMLASTVYDPTNLLGAGLGAKALETGAVTSRLGRGLATADKALDVAQTKAALPLIGGVAGFAASATTGGDTKDNLIAAVIGAAGAKVAPVAIQKLMGELAIRAADEPALARALVDVMGRHGVTSPAELIARGATDTAIQGELAAVERQFPKVMPSGAMGAGLPVVGSVPQALDSTYDLATKPAELLSRAYGRIPGLKGYGAAPDELGLETIIGARNSKEGLKASERLGNWIREKAGGEGIPADALKTIGHDVMNDPRTQPIVHELERNIDGGRGQANRLMEKARNVLKKFDLDENGLIKDTELFPDQEAAIRQLGDELAQYRAADIGMGREIGFRPSVLADAPTFTVGMNPAGMDIRDLADQMGVYLPRGRPEEDGLAAVTRVTGPGRRGGKPGAEKSAVYDSVAQGMANKEVYPSLTEATQDYALTMGRALAEQHAANQVLLLTDAAGERMAKTSADRVPTAIRQQHDVLAKKLISLRKQVATAEKQFGVVSAAHDELDDALEQVVKNKPGETRPLAKIPKVAEKLDAKAERLTTERFGKPSQEPVRIKMPVSDTAAAEAQGIQETLDKLNELVPDDIDKIRFLDSAVLRTQKRLAALADRRTGKFFKLDVLGKELTRIEDEVKALAPQWKEAISKGTPRGQGTIGLNALSPYSVPNEVSNAFNHALKNMQPISGQGSKLVTVPEAINGFLRGVGASLDMSYTAIQGLVGATKDPAAYMKAWTTALGAWKNEAAFGRYLEGIDTRKPAGLTSQDVARYVTTSGGEAEYISAGLGKLPFFHQSNRSFGTFGDVVRYELFINSVEAAQKSGRVIDENFLTGLGKAVDRASGTTEKRFGGDLGSLAMFAPRFFQSQLEMVGKALTDGTIEGDFARESLLKLTGTGVLMTVGINEALGNETDFRLTVGGKMNPNFMRIRVAGQDVSLFGPWDSLLRIAVNASPVAITESGVGLQKPDLTYGLRSKASPIVSHGWDLSTGKNFRGEDVGFTSSEGLQNLGRSFAPFGLSNVGKGEGGGIAQTIVGLSGLKTTPMSEREQRDADVKDSGIVSAVTGKPATRYDELSGIQQQEWDKSNGKIESKSDLAKESRKIDAERMAAEGEIAKLHPVNEHGVMKDPRGFREEVGNLQMTKAVEKKKAIELLGNFDNGKPKDPIDRALWEYYDTFTRASGPSSLLDFDAQAKYLADAEATWTPEQKTAVEQRRRAEHTQEVQQLYDEKKQIGDSGYWDIWDKAWANYQKAYPETKAAASGSFNDWYESMVESVAGQLVASGTNPKSAKDEAIGLVEKTETYKAFDANKTKLRDSWVIDHKDDGIAELAWKWEYITANKYRKFLFGN